MVELNTVRDDEFVLRRIHRSFYDATLPIPIRPAAFRPNPNDTTGLSVFRACFGQPPDILANIDPPKAKEYYVARLSVEALRSLGLTIQPDPIPGGPLGHAIIPQLSWPGYQANKTHWKPVLIELAKLASFDLVHVPGPDSA